MFQIPLIRKKPDSLTILFLVFSILNLLVTNSCREVSTSNGKENVPEQTPSSVIKTSQSQTPISTAFPSSNPTLTPTNTPAPPTAIPTPVFSSVDLLPLAVGNVWTYTKTVNPDQDVWYWEYISLKDDRKVFVTGRGRCGSGSYMETYRIAAKVEDISEGISGWEIEIESPDGCLGRYEDMEQIFWYLEPASYYVGHEIEGIRAKAVEHTLLNLDSYPSDFSNTIVDPPTLEYPLLLVWETLGNRYGISERTIGSGLEWTYSDLLVTVETPAGSFDECVEVIEDVKTNSETEEIEEMDDPFQTGWVTRSYYCSDVGLVKRIQETRNGNVTYTLELTDFTTPLSTKYDFENDEVRWKCQEDQFSQACSMIVNTNEIARDGQQSLKVFVNLVGGDINLNQGEVSGDYPYLVNL